MANAVKNEEIIIVLNGYAQKTREERKKAQTFMIEKLKGFIIDLANKFVGLAEFDDLYQAGCLAVCAAIETYDPKRTLPTTYFRPYIVGNMQKLCFGEQSQYYCSVQKKINDACKKFNAALAPNDPNSIQDFTLVADEKLANITGLPIATIKEAKRQQRQSVSSLTAVGESIADEYNDSPENMLLKKEREEELHDSLKELTPLESYIITKSYLGDKEASIKSIARELNKPEVKIEFSISTSVDAVFVEKKRENALKKIRAFYKKRNGDAPIAPDYLSELDASEVDLKNDDDTAISLEDLLAAGTDIIDLF